jgi:hypothetical protein
MLASAIVLAMLLQGCGSGSDAPPATAPQTYSIGGTTAGPAGSGLALQINGGGDLSVGANGNFGFAALLPSGTAYAVTIKTQPVTPTQTCTVTNGTGSIAGSNVTNVALSCSSNSYKVGGQASGVAGSGLTLRLGAEVLSVTGNGTFAFPTHVASGTTFAVLINTQPANPTQTRTLQNATGAVTNADISNLTVTCATIACAIRGTVGGLIGAGLQLELNGAEMLDLNANGAFGLTTPVLSAAYQVTVRTQPAAPAQTCVLKNAAGVLLGSEVNDCRSSARARPPASPT